MLVARSPGGDVVGTVSLVLPPYPNAAHRAEVSKLLVAGRARGRGAGRLLLRAAEARAAALGRHVLLLDTESESPAEALYRSEGWEVVGVVPEHAARPDGELAPTTYLTKRLRR